MKNHDFTQKNHIFSNFRGGAPAPPWSVGIYHCHMSLNADTLFRFRDNQYIPFLLNTALVMISGEATNTKMYSLYFHLIGFEPTIQLLHHANYYNIDVYWFIAFDNENCCCMSKLRVYSTCTIDTISTNKLPWQNKILYVR